jgi:hypothetical protein
LFANDHLQRSPVDFDLFAHFVQARSKRFDLFLLALGIRLACILTKLIRSKKTPVPRDTMLLMATWMV